MTPAPGARPPGHGALPQRPPAADAARANRCVHTVRPSSQLCDGHTLLEAGLTLFTLQLSQSRNIISDNAAVTGTCRSAE